MIETRMIKAATYLGDRDNPEDRNRHAIFTHSTLRPDVREILLEELPEGKRNDLELVGHLNQELL